MSARELTIPESVRHLDGEAVIDALSRHNGNISAAAKDLGVPSADFRAFLRPNPRYQAAANELIERRQDLADAAILEALEHPDLRYRLPAAMFQSRYSTVAAARGWITNAPVDAEPVTAGPRRIEIRWGGTPTQKMETITRDGREIEVPCYDVAAKGEAAALPQPLKQLSSVQRDKILARITDAPDDRAEIIEHVKQKGFDVSEFE
jgi:hypothetical protein